MDSSFKSRPSAVEISVDQDADNPPDLCKVVQSTLTPSAHDFEISPSAEGECRSRDCLFYKVAYNISVKDCHRELLIVVGQSSTPGPGATTTI